MRGEGAGELVGAMARDSDAQRQTWLRGMLAQRGVGWHWSYRSTSHGARCCAPLTQSVVLNHRVTLSRKGRATSTAIAAAVFPIIIALAGRYARSLPTCAAPRYDQCHVRAGAS